MSIKGYKVFNPDWTCRGFQYEVGKTFKHEGNIEMCGAGFHFCQKISDCFNYYDFNSNNKVAEVEAIGRTETRGGKSVTDEIAIIKELTWHEVLDLANTGKDCTGNWNSGDRNSGDRNSGDRNSGNWNSGDWNSGNWNSGDWNKTNFSNGCFNTEEPKIFLFNKPSDWTYRDWLNSDARYLLNQIPKNVVEWIYSSDMSDEEKTAHPEHETTGGYLKILDEKDCDQIWWNGLSERNRSIIKALPNFDAGIFEAVTGIKVD